MGSSGEPRGLRKLPNLFLRNYDPGSSNPVLTATFYLATVPPTSRWQNRSPFPAGDTGWRILRPTAGGRKKSDEKTTNSGISRSADGRDWGLRDESALLHSLHVGTK